MTNLWRRAIRMSTTRVCEMSQTETLARSTVFQSDCRAAQNAADVSKENRMYFGRMPIRSRPAVKRSVVALLVVLAVWFEVTCCVGSERADDPAKLLQQGETLTKSGNYLAAVSPIEKALTILVDQSRRMSRFLRSRANSVSSMLRPDGFPRPRGFCEMRWLSQLNFSAFHIHRPLVASKSWRRFSVRKAIIEKLKHCWCNYLIRKRQLLELTIQRGRRPFSC
jgi:hypothetical protein